MVRWYMLLLFCVQVSVEQSLPCFSSLPIWRPWPVGPAVGNTNDLARSPPYSTLSHSLPVTATLMMKFDLKFVSYFTLSHSVPVSPSLIWNSVPYGLNQANRNCWLQCPILEIASANPCPGCPGNSWWPCPLSELETNQTVTESSRGLFSLVAAG